jgi:glutamine amidotransferase-like uncharacterized protein
VPYTIRVCYDQGQVPSPGSHPEWTFVWYQTEHEAEEAARELLKRTNADRVEIRDGQETVVREVNRPD